MIPRLNDKELKKWSKILGPTKLEFLYIESKIYLSQKQLDYLIELKKTKKEG